MIFDLQFFGGGGSRTEQVRKRDPEPQELIDLRNRINEGVKPSMDYFEGKLDYDTAPEHLKNAIGLYEGATQGMTDTLGNISKGWERYNLALDDQRNLMANGVPLQFQANLYDSINRNANESMGTMLANNAAKGIINSSVSTAGLNNINRESQNQMSSQYLNMFDRLGQQYDAYAKNSYQNIVGLNDQYTNYANMGKQAWDNYYAPSQGGYNFWNDWQNSYDRREDYDTVVHQGK